MIISETVQQRWNNRIVKYYKSKGYAFTKEGDYFEVKVSDLQPSSLLMVLVRCEQCGAERYAPYYVAVSRVGGGNLCNRCALSNANPKIAKKKCQTHGSFLDACREQIGEEQFKKYWSDKNTLDPASLCYGSKVKVWMKCRETFYHDDYEISCQRFLKGSRCPQCSNYQTHPLDSLQTYMDSKYGDGYALSRWSSMNAKSPLEYSCSSNKKAWFTCPEGIHDDYLQGIGPATRDDYHCPQCTRERTLSYLQEKVENYISEKYGYEMLHEYKCNLLPRNPFTGQILRYDLEIEKIKLIIEVNGEQHYKATSYFNTRFRSRKSIKTPEEELAYQQLKDAGKKQHAIGHGYSYLEIPYWTEKSKNYESLIDNAISLAISKQSEVTG